MSCLSASLKASCEIFVFCRLLRMKCVQKASSFLERSREIIKGTAENVIIVNYLQKSVMTSLSPQGKSRNRLFFLKKKHMK